MKKIICFLFVMVGFGLIGFGSFQFFEQYDSYLKQSDMLDGVYTSLSGSITVNSFNDTISVTRNNETNRFELVDGFYKSEIFSFLIKVEDNCLLFINDGEVIEKFCK